jgi:DnaJ-domain-containing protein 1
MASIANLAVILSANTAKFTAGMLRAQKQLVTFQRVASKVTLAAGGIGAALAGVAGAASIGAMVKRQFELADALGKTADRLGLTTEELGRLRFAGEQTGVGMRTMDMALQRMVRRVSEAAAGTGEAQNALRELGLDARKLEQRGPAQAFRDIAEAMQQVQNPLQRVRLAQKLFDSEGVALVNTLNLGAAGLDELGKRADELGLTLDREAVARIEMANDAMNELRHAMYGLAAVIAREVAPWVTATAREFTSMATDADGLGESVFRAMELIGKGVVLADFGFDKMMQTVESWRGGMLHAMASVLRGFAKLNPELQTLADAIDREAITAALNVIASDSRTLEERMADLNERMASIRAESERMRREADERYGGGPGGLEPGPGIQRATGLQQIQTAIGALRLPNSDSLRIQREQLRELRSINREIRSTQLLVFAP